MNKKNHSLTIKAMKLQVSALMEFSQLNSADIDRWELFENCG